MSSRTPLCTSWVAVRAQHERGHVAMAVVPYVPRDVRVPAEVRARHQPWECTFHCEDGGPRRFVAFGGQAGMQAVVADLLGARLASATPMMVSR